MTVRPFAARLLPAWVVPQPSVMARLIDRIEAARNRARRRAELRQRLRADAHILRDMGLTRFDAMRLTAGE
jgi:uncharacterized protein YjiS (DUF1127 family)